MTRLRVGGIKTFVDGAIGGRTCLMEEPFEGTSDDFGMQTLSDAELRDVVRMVHGDGNRVCTHANGDRAIGKLLDQLEARTTSGRSPDLHHRIEHCSIVNDEILGRMKALGAIAAPFGSYVHYHGGKLLDWYGPRRIERMFAHRAFLDRGIAVAGSSDYPCGPYQPLLALQSCVTRTGFDGAPLGLSQRISPLEALGLYTPAPAYASGEAGTSRGSSRRVISPTSSCSTRTRSRSSLRGSVPSVCVRHTWAARRSGTPLRDPRVRNE